MTDPHAQLAEFVRALGHEGIRATLGDALDAAEALEITDQDDQRQVACSLRIALKIPRPAFATFERLFALYWGDGSTNPEVKPIVEPALKASRAPRPPASNRSQRQERGILRWDPDQRQLVMTPTANDEARPTQGEEPGASSEALFKRKRLDEFGDSERDQARLEAVLSRLTRRLASLQSRRWVRSERRGRADLRASYRKAFGTGGELVQLAWRRRAIDEARIVLLCDTSGSMDPFNRFLVHFAVSLKRAVRKTEVFVFNTELVHVTRLLSARDLELTLERLSVHVPDWSGGTRLGQSLSAFVDFHLGRHVDRKTVVVVFSDGLDRGDPRQLAERVREIQLRAKKVIWLNPLLGHPGYEPGATSLQAALPYLDHFLAARDLESLERALPHLIQ